MVVLSPEEIKKAERAANDGGLDYETMMRTAGRGCADYILAHYPPDARIVIIAGKGKNGGDGFVCAKALCLAKRRIRVILALGLPTDTHAQKMLSELSGLTDATDYTKSPAEALRALSKADVVADAVFGVGFHGAFPEQLRALIEKANALPVARIAIDLPSGVGALSEEAQPFKADVTLSMLCYKPEQIYKPAAGYCGKTQIVPIGFPAPDGSLFALTRAEVKMLLPDRPYNANKGTFGNVLVLGGSRKMPGAAVLAAMGALHGGAGLVTVAVPDCILPVIQTKLTDPVFFPLQSSADGMIGAENIAALAPVLPRFSAIVLGNGMGVSPDTRQITAFILQNSICPVVLDADGINCVAGNINILKEARCPVLLTPHPGEMGRLTGRMPAEVNDDRETCASAFAAAHGVNVLLKGANTVAASPDGRLTVNPTGSAALARGGSGDILAGLIGAFAAQGTALYTAAALGAYVHGLAGETAEEKYSSFSATAARVTEAIGQAFKMILEG